MLEPWERAEIISLTQLLLDSHEHWTGKALCSRGGSEEMQARALFLAPFVVVSHGIEAEPIFNYGNRMALELWEMDFDVLLKTPSSKTAEPVHQSERERMLAQALRHGFIDDYSGVRISSTGTRFKIERATIWNVQDSRGKRRGQAATFSHWHYV